MTEIEFKQLQECAYAIGCEIIHDRAGFYRLTDIGKSKAHIVSDDPLQIAVRVGEIRATEPDRLPF